MKKTYIVPEMLVMNVEMQNLMAGSQLSKGEDWASGEAASRGASWDDED